MSPPPVDGDDLDYVLGCGDEVLGAPSVRSHAWPWLRAEAGDAVRVDAWFPDHGDNEPVDLHVLDVLAVVAGDWGAAEPESRREVDDAG